jgi:hypothetical protein
MKAMIPAVVKGYFDAIQAKGLPVNDILQNKALEIVNKTVAQLNDFEAMSYLMDKKKANDLDKKISAAIGLPEGIQISHINSKLPEKYEAFQLNWIILVSSFDQVKSSLLLMLRMKRYRIKFQLSSSQNSCKFICRSNVGFKILISCSTSQ